MVERQIPIIDISALNSQEGKLIIAKQIAEACTTDGFFYISGHGISQDLQNDLMKESAQFFNLPVEQKMEISMNKGGKAWRGFFPVNGELTSGKPDLKQGLYFGQELSQEHPNVKKGLPLHGSNQFPSHPQKLKQTVLTYIKQITNLGQRILQGIALSLNLDQKYFYEKYTSDPLVLFRIFHYPAQQTTGNQWGVGQHTDYGLLTILLQDQKGGLQVKSQNKWISAPPVHNTFICNIGDMLDRITGGYYRSTPHRVLNSSGKSRYSFPLFLDPAFSAEVNRIEGISTKQDKDNRWDNSSVHEIKGNYGDYLLGKVGKVFPDLKDGVLEGGKGGY